jgi:hypothetical protein
LLDETTRGAEERTTGEDEPSTGEDDSDETTGGNETTGGGVVTTGGGDVATAGGDASAGGGELAAGGGEPAAGGGELSAGGGELAAGGGGFGAAGVAGGVAGVFAGGAASDVAMVGRSREKEWGDGRELKRKAVGAGATRGARRCQTEEGQPHGSIDAPSPRKDIGLRPYSEGLRPELDESFPCIMYRERERKRPRKISPVYCKLVHFQGH